jgi:hypothetical protein
MALTFVKLNDVLAAGSVPLVRAHTVRADTSAQFAFADGIAQDHSHVLVSGNGQVIFGPPGDTVFYEVTSAADVNLNLAGGEFMQGVTVAAFDPLTETGVFVLTAQMQNSGLPIQNRDLYLRLVVDTVLQSEHTYSIGPGENLRSFSAPLTAPIANGATVGIRMRGDPALWVRGSQTVTDFRLVKAA